jgi:4-(gamma-glutamylamino)butanal dehydrogenase
MSLLAAQHVIDGAEVAALSGKTFQTAEPATSQPLAELAFGEAVDVDRAVRSAADAFTDRRWAGLHPAEDPSCQLRRLPGRLAVTTGSGRK